MSENEIQDGVAVENNDDLDAFTTEFLGGNKVADPKPDAKPEDAEQDVVVDDNKDADESQKDELTDEDEAEAELEAAKPKSKVQERIDELVKQKHDAERAAKAEIDALRKEFEALKAQREAPPAKPTATEPNPDDTDANGVEKYPLGEFDPLYIKDLTRYTLESERAAVRIAEEQERATKEQADAATALHQSWTEKVEPAKVKYPDFAEKGQALLDGFGGLDEGYAQYLSTVLMSMDFGPDVLYYLSNHPDEATKIVNSGAQKATIALGRIEAKFVEAEAEKQVAKPKVSKAPAPPLATARGTGSNAGGVADDTDDLDAFTSKFFAGKRR